jgi:hypothetical protein
MLLKEIVEVFQRRAGGGVFDNETRYDISFSEDTIHQARATIIYRDYQSNKKINPIWTQQFIGTFSQDLQESKTFVKFACPPVITLDDFIDGFMFVGNLTDNVSYRKVANRASLANSNVHRYLSLNVDTPKFIYSDGYIEIYGNAMIKQLKVDGIFNDPTKIPTFNKEYDQYPADLKLINSMVDYVFNTEIKNELSEGDKIKFTKGSK